VPVTAVAGLHFARFRISSTIVTSPLGFVVDGEVEDHPVNILSLLPFVPVPDTNVATDDGVAVSGNVLANDTDPNGGPSTFVANPGTYQGTFGTLVLDISGDYTYLVTDETIGTGFVSSDAFTVEISDGIALLGSALTIQVNGSNDPPQIISPNTFSIDENTITVAQVVGSDIDVGTSLTYSLGVNGDDTSLFDIDPVTGELTFLVAPNFELPSDFNTDSVYEVEVQVSDGEDSATQLLQVTVNDVEEDPAPQIVAVWVKSTSWTPQFLDAADGVVDDGFSTGYRIPDGKDQVKALPWSNIDRILVQFSEDVGASVDVGDFSISGVPGVLSGQAVQLPSVVSVTFDSISFIATLELDRRISNSYIDLAITASGIVDSLGSPLDGEWSNTVTIGNSGNGVAGGDFLYRFAVLPGDANQNGSVSISDLATVAAVFGSVVGSQTYSITRDVNGSGSISISDLANIASVFGTVLPSVPLSAMPATETVLATSSAASLSDSDWDDILDGGLGEV
ncbi:MAG: VCBS domain-containing protein, partial [Planctomycetales bacterium]|nr:VCBS domain-containing protein [Planctomycetales bacterium]